jgi:hypothetical protein
MYYLGMSWEQIKKLVILPVIATAIEMKNKYHA